MISITLHDRAVLLARTQRPARALNGHCGLLSRVLCVLPDGGSPVPVSLLMRQSTQKKPADATFQKVKEEVEEEVLGGGRGGYGNNTRSPAMFPARFGQRGELSEYITWPHELVLLHL